MKTEYKHIRFILCPQDPKRKTKRWICMTHPGQVHLGLIEWYGGWRQYVYFPQEETLYAKSCLDDISDFIRQLMELRKK